TPTPTPAPVITGASTSCAARAGRGSAPFRGRTVRTRASSAASPRWPRQRAASGRPTSTNAASSCCSTPTPLRPRQPAWHEPAHDKAAGMLCTPAAFPCPRGPFAALRCASMRPVSELAAVGRRLLTLHTLVEPPVGLRVGGHVAADVRRDRHGVELDGRAASAPRPGHVAPLLVRHDVVEPAVRHIHRRLRRHRADALLLDGAA